MLSVKPPDEGGFVNLELPNMGSQSAKDARRARRLDARLQQNRQQPVTVIERVEPLSAGGELIALFLQSNFPTAEPRDKAKLTRLVYA